MDGFINLNKSPGWTSHDCVAKVRRLLRQKKVGHAGTLDPAAVGVLPIAIGRATRLLQFLPGDKTYRAIIRFGIQTATDDLNGDVIAQQDASQLTEAQVLQKLSNFYGTIQQTPPNYSAIQVDGKRLYALARQGKEMDVPARTVTVHDIAPLSWKAGIYPEFEVAIACGSGTYIRAIARDLGDHVGTGATLAFLERTESSGFPLSDSLTLDHLAKQIEQDEYVPIAPETALRHLPWISLERAIARRWRMGQKISISPQLVNVPDCLDLHQSVHSEAPLNIVSVFDEGDRFLGVGEYGLLPDGDASDATKESIAQSGSFNLAMTMRDSILLRPRMVFVPV